MLSCAPVRVKPFFLFVCIFIFQGLVWAVEPDYGIDTPGVTAFAASVGNRGQARSSIPVVVPKGVNGIQPNVSIGYSSAAGNRNAGFAWHVRTGVQVIGRCPQTVAQDSKVVAVTYTSTDRFCLNGQRLVLTSTTGTYGEVDTEYKTEVASFRQIKALGANSSGPPEYFEVTNRNGMKYTFGRVSAALDGRIYAFGTSTVREWRLSRVEDTNGNYMDYVYEEINSTTEEVVLNRINYTGNGAVLPRYTVDLVYESLVNDTRTMYQAGYPIVYSQRVASIKTLEGANLIREYFLDYETVVATNSRRNRLEYVTECANDDDDGLLCKEPLHVEWNQAAAGWNTASTLSSTSSADRFLVGDWDGDGKDDFFIAKQTTNPTEYRAEWEIVLGKNNLGGTPITTGVPAHTFETIIPNNRYFDYLVLDFNGDGRDDILQTRRADDMPGGVVYQSTGSASPSAFTTLTNVNYPSDLAGETRIVADYNGDGLDDIVVASKDHFYVAENNGSTFTIKTLTRDIILPNSGPEERTVEAVCCTMNANNDGASDLAVRVLVQAEQLCIDDEGEVDACPVYYYEWAYLRSTGDDYELSSIQTNSGTRNHELLLDINGDGLDDVSFGSGSSSFIGINQGDGTFDYSPGPSFAADGGIQSSHRVDYDRDGLMDRVVRTKNNTLRLFKSNGSTLQTSTRIYSSIGTNLVFADVNGDGYADLFEETNGAEDTTQMTLEDPVDPCAGLPSNQCDVTMPESGTDPETPVGTAKLSVHLATTADMVKRITDGYGNYSEYVYEPIADSDYYSQDESTSSAPFVRPYWGGMHVVVEHRMNDGIVPAAGMTDGQYQMFYEYKNAQRETSGRGFLGFEERTVEDSRNGVTSRTVFQQQFPFTGRVQEVDVKETANDRIRNTVYTWESETIAQAISGRLDRYFVHLEEMEEVEYEVDGVTTGTNPSLRRVKTDYSYLNATYGQMDGVIQEVFPSGSSTAKQKSTITIVPTAPGNHWCLALAGSISQKLEQSVYGSTNSTRKTTFVPDLPNCRLNGETQFSNAVDAKLRSVLSFGYDTFGNRTRTALKSAVSSSFENDVPFALRRQDTMYDASGYYPTEFIQCVGDGETGVCGPDDVNNPSSTIAWDEDVGLLSSVQMLTRGNVDEAITTAFDGFGRPAQTIRPDYGPNRSDDTVYEDCADSTGICTNANDSTVHKITQTYADGGQFVLYTDSKGRVVGTEQSTINSVTPMATVRVDTTYDNLGRVHQQTNPYLSTDTLTYNNTYGYDVLNRVTSIDQPIDESTTAGRLTTYVYDNFEVTRTDAEGRITRQEFDVLGQLKKSYEESLSIGGLVDHVAYTYDEWGSLLTTTNSTDGSVITNTYDERGRLATSNDPNRGLSEYKYDPADSLIWMKDAKGQVRKYRYDSLGRLTRREDIPNQATTGVVSQFAYYTNRNNDAGFGRLKHHVKLPASTNPKVEFQYDSLGRLIEEKALIPTDNEFEPTIPYVINRTYNSSLGQLDLLTYPDTFAGEAPLVLKHAYTKGVLTSIENNGTNQTYYTLDDLDAWGNVKQTTYGNSVVNSRLHNVGNPWVDSISSTKGGNTIRAYNFDWDNVGNLEYRQQTHNPTTLSESFAYDAKYRLKTATLSSCAPTNPNPPSCVLDVDYAANGNITSKNNLGSLYEYIEADSMGGPHAVSKIMDGTSVVASFTYDENGNLESRTAPANGPLSSLSIDWTTFDKPSYIEGSTSNTVLHYDANYSRYRQVEHKNNGEASETLYIGGLFERHISSLGATGSPSIGFRQFIFANGERVATLSNVQVSGADDTDGDGVNDIEDNCVLVANSNQRNTNDQVDDYGNECDPDLNNDEIVNFLDVTVYQNAFNTSAGDSSWNEDVDLNGDGSINFIDYFILTSYFLIGPGPSRNIEIGEKIQYFHTDHLGSIDAITDEDGELIGEYSYDAFGQRRNPKTWSYDDAVDREHLAQGIAWTSTTRGFTDHEQLRAVDLVHMNGRVYDPMVGRMLSADPLVPNPLMAQSFNRYSYVRNNPLSRIDPTGFTDIVGVEDTSLENYYLNNRGRRGVDRDEYVNENDAWAEWQDVGIRELESQGLLNPNEVLFLSPPDSNNNASSLVNPLSREGRFQARRSIFGGSVIIESLIPGQAGPTDDEVSRIEAALEAIFRLGGKGGLELLQAIMALQADSNFVLIQLNHAGENFAFTGANQLTVDITGSDPFANLAALSIDEIIVPTSIERRLAHELAHAVLGLPETALGENGQLRNPTVEFTDGVINAIRRRRNQVPNVRRFHCNSIVHAASFTTACSL